jgi:hypothetical protein
VVCKIWFPKGNQEDVCLGGAPKFPTIAYREHLTFVWARRQIVMLSPASVRSKLGSFEDISMRVIGRSATDRDVLPLCSIVERHVIEIFCVRVSTPFPCQFNHPPRVITPSNAPPPCRTPAPWRWHQTAGVSNAPPIVSSPMTAAQGPPSTEWEPQHRCHT